jgi:hypothetical protein
MEIAMGSAEFGVGFVAEAFNEHLSRVDVFVQPLKSLV